MLVDTNMADRWMGLVATSDKAQELRENRLTAIRGVVSYAKQMGNDTGQKPPAISNRRNRGSRPNPRQDWIAAK
ncbi:MAG: hypothetical protein WC830_01780 [Burkholderiales bacterium]|jgi:hypothetical protein